MATKVKKYKNVYEKLDSYIPVENLTEKVLLDNDFMISELGDALKVTELSNNPFTNYVLNVMIDPEDVERSHNYIIDGGFNEIPLDDDTEDMYMLRKAVFEELNNLVEDQILEMIENIEIVAPVYRNKK